MREVLDRASRDRRRGPPLRPVQALLGRRRQRPEHGRRRGGADQAQRALLQVDRLRRRPRTRSTSTCRREPLILVCAAGLVGVDRRRRRQGGGDLQGPQGDADRHRHRRRDALRRRGGRDRRCPPSTRRSAFVLSAMVGHLFGYEAALAIDASARPLREARERDRAARRAGGDGDQIVPPRAAARLRPSAEQFLDGLRTGCYDGHLEASTAVRAVGAAARRAGRPPLEAYQRESRARSARRACVIDDLIAALTRGDRRADPAGRRDQAPGQDRHGRHLAAATRACSTDRSCRRCSPPAPAATCSATARSRCSPISIRRSPTCVGFTRYRIEGDPASDAPSRSSTAAASRATSPSRVERNAQLRRHQAPRRRPSARCSSARGRSDGRTVIFVPEVKGGPDHRHHAAARPLPRPPARRA